VHPARHWARCGVRYVDSDEERCAASATLGAEVEHRQGPWPRRYDRAPITVEASGELEGLTAALRSTEDYGFGTSARRSRSISRRRCRFRSLRCTRTGSPFTCQEPIRGVCCRSCSSCSRTVASIHSRHRPPSCLGTSRRGVASTRDEARARARIAPSPAAEPPALERETCTWTLAWFETGFWGHEALCDGS